MSHIQAVGIDLGTTFSCVSVYRNGRPELIQNEDGDRIIPSTVYFDPKTGEVSVGKIADDLSLRCPSNGLHDVKRFIGRKFDDEAISRYKNSKHTKFSLVRGENDQVAFELEISGKKVIKKPEEVSAEVLKHLRGIASEYLDGDVTEAVISIPAYFSNAQRKATKKAAELAGLKVLKLITEPTAAAIHYVKDKSKNNLNILVFDFGGGTLDVSLINVGINTFEVRSVYGDTLLGGRDIDDNLFNHFYQMYTKNHNHKKKFKDAKYHIALGNVCTKLKKNLSTKQDYLLSIDLTESDMAIYMKRTEFDDLNKDIFDRAFNIVRLCLIDTGLSATDIDKVVLVGGSTRILRLRKMLSDHFGGEKIKTDLNPDEAVAAGASIHAALLKGEDLDLEIYKITEVTPMSLGVIEYGQLMSTFIPRNSLLPASNSQTFITIYNNQKNMLFKICEGERKNAIYNNELGEFTVSDLPLRRAGDVKFIVKFELDEDGILNVTASEISTGKSNKLVVTLGQFRWSDRRIKLSVEEAKKCKDEDDTFEKFIILRNKLLTRCRRVMYDSRKISTKADRTIVDEFCNDFLKYSGELSYTDIDKLKAEYEAFRNSISDILRNNSIEFEK